MRELALDSEQAAPAQTAAMEAAWFPGNLVGLTDGAESKGLSEARVGNRFEALAVGDETEEGVIPAGSGARTEWAGASLRHSLRGGVRVLAWGLCIPAGRRGASLSAPGGRRGS